MRRSILLTFFGLALFYPFLNLQDWIKQHDPIVEVIMIYSSLMPATTATGIAETTTNWAEVLFFTLSGIYWLGVLSFITRFIIQFFSIIWIRIKSRKMIINDVSVYKLNEPAGPFSFFKLIFIHPENHSGEEIAEIMTHELTHVRQWHSIDVILSELFCVFCWFNPFVWLLKREVRHNLEYLADNRVLQSGYDSKNYQYHLLGLAHHQSGTSLYNNFNVLHLKNRILMMNKKRSSAIGRTKYLLFIPLVMLLMLISNIDAVARITKDFAASVIQAADVETPSFMSGLVVDSYGAPLPGTTIIINDFNTENMTVSETKPVQETIPLLNYSNPGMNTEKISIPEDNEPMTLDSGAEDVVFTVVEQMPEFPGGDAELMKFISKSIRYPVFAQENGIQGRVVCTFTISQTGKITNPEIIRGIDKTLDEEAIRVINSMPDWKPGKQRNRNVRVKYTLPVSFRLQ